MGTGLSQISSALIALIQAGSNLLIPQHCAVCQRIIQRDVLCSQCSPPWNGDHSHNQHRCSRCASPSATCGQCESCRELPSLLYLQRYLWNYAGRAHDLLCAAKYQPNFRLACAIADKVAGTALDHFPRRPWDSVIGIPPRSSHLRQRLFNLPTLVAQAIALRHTGLTHLPQALLHTGQGVPQASLTVARRLTNVRKAFQAEKQLVEGRTILIIDDVVTTGATASAAAQALYRAGATEVDLLSLARAPRWSESRTKVALLFGDV